MILPTEIHYRTVKVPPEGGFGYIVLLGVALPQGFCWGIFMVFGLLFDEFLKNINAGTSAVTIIMGFLNIAISLSALFAGTISKKLSVRSTAVLGGISFFVGSLLCIFATSVEYLIVSYGILLGVGMGFIIPSSYSTFNEYFVKKRILMMGIAQSIIGIVMMVYPLMVQFLLNTFGFRGALAIIAAINGNAVLGMLLMHPVKWHYKVIQVPIEVEIQPMINQTAEENEVTNIVTNKIEDETDENGRSSDVINDYLHENKLKTDQKSTASLHSDSTIKRASIVSFIGNGPIIYEPQMIKSKWYQQILIWNKLIDFLNLNLLKDLIFLNIIMGFFFVSFSEDYFLTLQPLYLIDINISKNDTALILAITAGFDVGSRIFLSIISVVFNLPKARYLYIMGAIASVIFRIGFLYVMDFMGLAIASAAIGFFKTFIHVTKPLVVAEYLPKDQFASGYGLCMFLTGVLTFLLSPFIGWIRDTTQSYVICFNTLNIIMGLCVVLWLTEFVWFQISPRQYRKSTTDIELSKQT